MTMTVAVLVPGGVLEFRELSWGEVEALAGGKHGATARTSLFRDGMDRHLVKLLSSDVALLFPEDYGVQAPAVSRLVGLLGGPLQPWAGVLAVYGIDSVEGGWPQSLTDLQQAVVRAAYESAVAG